MTTANGHEHGLTADAVTDELRKMILSGAVGIGVQLKQEALAKRFGVSRFPVREALRRLQAEGLLTHTPKRRFGRRFAPVADLVEICDIRIGLETRALALAIPDMRAADVKAIRSILTRYDASDSPREWTELDLEFHLALYRPCGRARMLKMIEDIVRSSDIQLRAKESPDHGPQDAADRASQHLRRVHEQGCQEGGGAVAAASGAHAKSPARRRRSIAVAVEIFRITPGMR